MTKCFIFYYLLLRTLYLIYNGSIEKFSIQKSSTRPQNNYIIIKQIYLNVFKIKSLYYSLF